MRFEIVEREGELRGLAEVIGRGFVEGRRAFDLVGIVARALPPLPPKRAVVRVISVGKAAGPMMRGALERWPDRIERGLVVTVEGMAGLGDRRVEEMEGAHPVPDERSEAAAVRAMELCRGLTKADLVVVLVSGGASALVSLPPVGMALAEKRALVTELIASGAPIQDINLIRRHCSRIKGGRLAAAAAPARVLTLAISDVIHGSLHDIASGPSVPDPTTLPEALDALRRFAPTWVGRAPLTESLKLPDAPRTRARIIADPDTFAAHIADHLRATTQLTVRLLPAEEGDAETLAARRIDQARALSPREALVIPCEPSLRVPAAHGIGGRSGWLSLRALLDLPDDVALLCGATDGADGPSATSGAVVTAAHRSLTDRPTIEHALSTFNDAPLHAALETHLPGPPTPLNFADLHILARLP